MYGDFDTHIFKSIFPFIVSDFGVSRHSNLIETFPPFTFRICSFQFNSDLQRFQSGIFSSRCEVQPTLVFPPNDLLVVNLDHLLTNGSYSLSHILTSFRYSSLFLTDGLGFIHLLHCGHYSFTPLVFYFLFFFFRFI